MMASGHYGVKHEDGQWPLFLFWHFATMVAGMPTEPPSRALDKFVLRFPDGMRDRIAAEAKANNRSMNSEIVARLEASFEIDLDAYRRDTDRLEELLRRHQATEDTMQKLITNLQEVTARLAANEGGRQ